MKTGRIATAAVVLALAAFAAHAQEGSTPAAGAPPAGPAKQPRLEVPDVSFNFGYVEQGASISHVFWLRNVGGDTLRITDVRPG